MYLSDKTAAHFPSDKFNVCLIAGIECNLFDWLFKSKSIRISELRVDFTTSLETERLIIKVHFLLPHAGIQLNYGLVSQYIMLYSFILRFDSFFFPQA